MRIRVAEDGTVSGCAPEIVPPGEHEATVTVAPVPDRVRARKPFDVRNLPTVNLGPWPKNLRLGREEIYADDES